ncbi:uncharacterized protein LOC118451354 [Vespa mandarinia]|uniref:uncharacterized protein LOC118451354 n=1 Tax=Vespa mandarinia TaxID=7446 RepID=UPI00161A049F|nr:uncharacterized protein LOC118451354 [Vespa mandarinia]
MLRFFIFIAICTICSTNNTKKLQIEKVTDQDLLNLIKTEKYVVTLFTKSNCKESDDFEKELFHVREDLVDSLSAWVVKVTNSQLLHLYSPEKEPILVFFRHGNPLLYTGAVNDEEILTALTENKELAVKTLTDDTFEHLTQASSGATTGDWFIMFYATNDVNSLRMGARWETVGAKLKHSVNVARVDKYISGAATARRFNVYNVPEFIFFRHGKMYRYQIPKYDVNSLVSFARDWYRNAHAEKVPVPQSPFDDLTQKIADFLRENPWVMKIGSITIGVLVIVSVASKLRHKTDVPQKKEQ